MTFTLKLKIAFWTSLPPGHSVSKTHLDFSFQDFEIHVLEKQSRFVQKIQTDLNTNHVYYVTPAHNDVYESHRIQDFTKVGILVDKSPLLYLHEIYCLKNGCNNCSFDGSIPRKNERYTASCGNFHILTARSTKLSTLERTD